MKNYTIGYVEVTNCDLRQLVKLAYAMSESRGMGLMHYQPGELSEADADAVLNGTGPDLAVRMDYVRGRCVKMNIYRYGDKLFVRNSWFDHTDEQFQVLLSRLGVDWSAVTESRAAEKNYWQECGDRAVAWLLERGGSVVDDWNGAASAIPDDVSSGLYHELGSRVRRSYPSDSATMWSVVQDEKGE